MSNAAVSQSPVQTLVRRATSASKRLSKKLGTVQPNTWLLWLWLTVLFLVLLLPALTADFISPHDPLEINLRDALVGPVWSDGGSSDHLLGTDDLGRDILTRLLYGTRPLIQLVIVAVVLSGMLGSILGLVSGFVGGVADIIIMRAVEITSSVPAILLALLLAAVYGPSFWNVVIVVVFIYWARYARQVRGEVVTLRSASYIDLARVAGASPMRLMFRHMLPNVFNTIVVLGTFESSSVVILDATLSFLGVGTPPPDPTWGAIISDGRSLLRTAPWVSIAPGVAITFVALSLNNIGDLVRDRLDPRLREA